MSAVRREADFEFPFIGTIGDDVTFRAKARAVFWGREDDDGKFTAERAEILESSVVVESMAAREAERLAYIAKRDETA